MTKLVSQELLERYAQKIVDGKRAALRASSTAVWLENRMSLKIPCNYTSFCSEIAKFEDDILTLCILRDTMVELRDETDRIFSDDS